MYNIYIFRTEIDIETLKQHKDMAVLSVSPVSYPERLAFWWTPVALAFKKSRNFSGFFGTSKLRWEAK